MLKSWLRRTALELDVDKVDRGPRDCHRRLEAFFGSDEWRAAHDEVKYKIKQIAVPWTDENVIKRPSHYERDSSQKVVLSERPADVDPLTGVSSNYSFAVLGDEKVGVRRNTCWCLKCLREL